MRKISESKKKTARGEWADRMEFVFSTPAGANSAVEVLRPQLRAFVDVQSKVEAKGSRLVISISGNAQGRDTALLCAKRLAELMLKTQGI